jgi:hypothetical protein
MLFNGVEYEASWGDAMRIAASARAAYARKPTPPAGDDAAIIRQPVVVNDVDQRIDISAQAATNPYLNVALLERPYHPKGNRAVTLTALCTCFKVDQFTCVTAAHCLANNWVKESGRTWRTQSTIQFGAGAPLGPPLPELKPKDTPYSIVIPAGYWTDGAPVEYLSRFDIAVIRFSGPLMSSSVGGEYAPVSGPPLFVNPTVPKQFYDTGSSGFFDMTELLLSANQTVAVVGYPEDSVPRLMYDNGPLRPPSGDGRLLYRVDTNPGESGGPVLWVDEQNRLRVVGVHRGPGPFGWNLGVELTGGLIDWINEVHGYEVR